MPFQDDVELLIRARYPLLYILTGEELRAIEILVNVAARRQKKIYEWSCTGGLVPCGTSIQSKQRNASTRDPLVALDQVLEQVEPALFIFKDFHPWLTRGNPAVIRKLKDIALHLKNSFKTVLLLSPTLEVPPELDKELTVLNLPLPRHEDHGLLLDSILRDVRNLPPSATQLTPEDRDRLLEAALGLTLAEAENVFARILVKHGRLGGDLVNEVFAEKQQLIRKNGLLEYLSPNLAIDQIGGLAGLKAWLHQRSEAFRSEARDFGLPPPRGVLLLGVQGCGKSLCAKAVSDLWKLPLLRFDIGRLFGSYVGSSEENVRRAIAVAESVAPAVLWVDEIDKAFAGSSGPSLSDGGTSARVFGTFLTWLSEKTAPVFVVATANDISHLPPELLRKGRFDEIFFVDLPSASERLEIFRVHLLRRGRSPDCFDLDALVDSSRDFSGAEIEESIVAGLFEAFSRREELLTDHLQTALRQTFPLAKTMVEQVTRLRQWASGRARNASPRDSES